MMSKLCNLMSIMSVWVTLVLELISKINLVNNFMINHKTTNINVILIPKIMTHK